MTSVDWNRLGPREKQVLAILRRADGRPPARAVLEELRASDEEIAYTTVSTVLDRLWDKGLVTREREQVRGTPRYRYAFDPDPVRSDLVEDVVEDVGAVLGAEGLGLLARRSRAAADDDIANRPDSS